MGERNQALQFNLGSTAEGWEVAGTLHPAPTKAAEQSSFPTKSHGRAWKMLSFHTPLDVRNPCSGLMGSLKHWFHSRDGERLNFPIK